jgi:PAP_fibrillin
MLHSKLHLNIFILFLSIHVIIVLCIFITIVVESVVVSTTKTKALLREYLKTQPAGFSVVENGGYYHLERKVAASFGLERIPSNLNVVNAGGWYHVQQLAADPKGMLTGYIAANAAGPSSVVASSRRLKEEEEKQFFNTVLSLLENEGKGFSSDLVDGPWLSVWDQSSKSSPRFQKLVERLQQKRKPKRLGTKKPPTKYPLSDFYVSEGCFRGKNAFGKRSELTSTVRYEPIREGYTTTPTTRGTRIVLRRIACTIVNVSLKLGPFPRFSLPTPSAKQQQGGYLDFVYLDDDIRVTRGNRGGIFVHFRPEYFQKVMVAA